ncbi:MAG: hypothetical protein QN152_11920 [Armatimonadota bacterium]|nr:hypothetical protein [Armatimonadota bacterium]MDR7426812.1 hypothetical protein [Armatimonadota bacterium]MDR7463949.1 hypothetical protein [Armatimonadota bacterium]MDR7469902.1 hypothetical protein [Armatimonadota bacterium]MDR7474362.1 hypothetical protein [Armatimonadota bacterium]
MEQQRDGVTLQQQAEEIVRRLRGVISVRAEADPAGGLSVIHVLGEADRSPKLIAMDVASALAAELGAQVDPQQVRVSTLRSSELPPPPSPRLKYVGLTVASLRGTTEVKVHLEDRGLLYEGVASGPTAGLPLHLVATATLRAVEVFLRAAGLLILDGVRVTRVGEREVAVVVLTLAGRDGQVLSGSSVVRLDPREAVVRAVLNALNRPVGWLAVGRPQ